jgi:predicted anti-sigma-YlaC factor YlaD
MIQHAEYTMLMSLVLDGEACADEEVRLREHLRACDDCRQTWQRWRELDRRLLAAPVIPAPVDFSALVLAQLDARVAQERQRRWLIAGLTVAWLGAVLIALVSLAVSNGWHLQLAPEHGPLAAAWAGLATTGGWALREFTGFLSNIGAPTIAAVTGVALVLACGLAMMWLWVVARVSAGPLATVGAE